MPQYIRSKQKGGTFFFTLITHERRELLLLAPVLKALRESFAEIQQAQPFTLNAWVVLPDHMHCIWTLPDGDRDVSKRWGRIKAGVSRRLKSSYRFRTEGDGSSFKRGESPVWRRRFWEHKIRDELDMYAHLDYIHYNPVKHGLANSVKEWRFSSFHTYVERRIYSRDWGGGPMVDLRAGE